MLSKLLKMSRTSLPKTEPLMMLWQVASNVVYGLGGVATVVLVLAVFVSATIALNGTGGFTSDPPPAQSDWLGAIAAIAMGALLQWGLIRSVRVSLKAIDRKMEQI